MSFTIKRATTDNIEELIKWRTEAIENTYVGEMSIAEREILKYETKKYYERELPSEGHIACIVYIGIEKEPVGCGGMTLYYELPSAENPTGKCACLTNIYIREEHRKKGLATAVVTWLVFLAQERGIKKIYLNANDQSKKLFESLGFKERGDCMQLENPDAIFGCKCHSNTTEK